jgi:hypothetical protein
VTPTIDDSISEATLDAETLHDNLSSLADTSTSLIQQLWWHPPREVLSLVQDTAKAFLQTFHSANLVLQSNHLKNTKGFMVSACN